VNALIVHGGGAVFNNTSCNVGRRGQYGPVGIDRLKGLDGRKSPEDMKPSSSASQSERTDEQRGEVSLDDVCMCKEGGFRFFDFRIALRRYFMGTLRVRPSVPPPQTDCQPFQIQVSEDFVYGNPSPRDPNIIVSRAFEQPATCTGKRRKEISPFALGQRRPFTPPVNA
jgi:hypothetical protein